MHKNNKKILQTQQRFTCESHNAFTEKKKKKIASSSNDSKRMQSIDSIETYAYGTRKDLPSEKEKIESNNTIKLYRNN